MIYETLLQPTIVNEKDVPVEGEEEILSRPEKIRTQLDVIREIKQENSQCIARVLFFMEESSAIRTLPFEGVYGAMLHFMQPGLAAVVIEGQFDQVDQIFRKLSIYNSLRLVYFNEIHSGEFARFTQFSVHRQTATSTASAVSENTQELATAIGKMINLLIQVTSIPSDRISEETVNSLFPRSELIKVILTKGDFAMTLIEWDTLFADFHHSQSTPTIYTGDSDKLWPPLKV